VNVLDVQYRMHPAISTFPSQEFYQGRLKDGEVSEGRQTDGCEQGRPWGLQLGLVMVYCRQLGPVAGVFC
jgi:hypothetical protein